MPGLVIKMFLVDGEPEGLRTMELSNATVLGTFFPRPALNRFLARPASQRPGLYILLGTESDAGESDVERAYIGEGDPVGYRLSSHAREKDFWSHAAVFSSKDEYLSKTQIRYLEAALIAEAKLAARAELDNGNIPALPNVSEADRAEVEIFLAHIRMLLGASGIRLLRPRARPVEALDDKRFILRVKTAEAAMVRTPTGYVVQKGSTALEQLTRSGRKSLRSARQRLLDAGVLRSNGSDLLEFTEDHEFGSPSGAAMMVAGRSASGLSAWRLADGRTLADVEEAETSVNS